MLRLLAGRARTALIPNAIDNRDGQEQTALMRRGIDELVGIGLEPVALDLRDYFGKASNFRATLAGVDLIYVRGGNPFILRRAFRQSGADAVLSDLLTNDAIASGAYSAGSCQSLAG